MLLPIPLVPVVALIEFPIPNNDQKREFYEVVFYSDATKKWESYNNSSMFNNREKVIDWYYPQTKTQSLQEDYFTPDDLFLDTRYTDSKLPQLTSDRLAVC